VVYVVGVSKMISDDDANCP